MTAGNSFKLNANQEVAVSWQHGPLLVLAGPGSGKTRVLAERVARLLMESPTEHFRILGLTFAHKAAMEMRERVSSYFAEPNQRAELTTFHSFAANILRQHGSHLSLKPDFRILVSDDDRVDILCNLLGVDVRTYSDKRSWVKANNQRVSKLFESVPIEESSPENISRSESVTVQIARLFLSYRAENFATNQLDVSFLVPMASHLLAENRAISDLVTSVYEYVCVDEFQDTSGTQALLLSLLAPLSRPNLFVVADPDQSIYQWTGASPGRIPEFVDRYEMKILHLPENYRCPPDIVDCANKLISHNQPGAQSRRPAVAIKVHTHASNIRVQRFPSYGDEINWLGEDLRSLSIEDRSGAVVLARTNRLVDEAFEALSRISLPAIRMKRLDEFESAPFRWMHALLHLINSPNHLSFIHKLNDSWEIMGGSELTASRLHTESLVTGASLLETWMTETVADRTIYTTARDLITSVQQLIQGDCGYLDLATNCQRHFVLMAAARPAISESDVFQDLHQGSEIWNKLLAEIDASRSLSNLPLPQFLQELDLRSKEPPAPYGAVRCMTISAAKGLEFKHVYLLGVGEGQLPHYLSTKRNSHGAQGLDEERQQCFVAITRTEGTLTLLHSDEYFGWTTDPSRFLVEMGLQTSYSHEL